MMQECLVQLAGFEQIGKEDDLGVQARVVSLDLDGRLVGYGLAEGISAVVDRIYEFLYSMCLFLSL